jgi:trk system potassium uptake protein
VHIVIMGCGRVGSTLAHILEDRGYSIAVIDRDAEAFRRLGSSFKGDKITGIGFDRAVLTQAGTERAAAFAAVSSGDNSNILCARIARETYGIEHVVARIYDPRRALIYQRLGIATVATVAWTTDQVLRRLLPGEAQHEWVDPSGKVCLVERAIPNAAVGKKLGLLNQPGRYWLTAVTRFGKAEIVTGDLVGQEGDVLHFVADTGALDALQHDIESAEGH